MEGCADAALAGRVAEGGFLDAWAEARIGAGVDGVDCTVLAGGELAAAVLVLWERRVQRMTPRMTRLSLIHI